MKIKLLPILAVLSASVILSGCESYSPDVGDIEKVDTNKTQLYIHTYDGGFGTEWLRKAKTSYELLRANDSLESGKKGVQIMIEANKSAKSADDIKNNTQELYFLQESKALNLFKQGAIEDITSVVTGDNKYEPGVTIESKLNDSQKAFFKNDGKYYAFPHYVGSWGISYNKDIFEERGYYIVKGCENETDIDFKFIGTEKGLEKSLGRDGVAGTEDDGLPESYQDYIDLCEFISRDNGHIPFTFSNAQKDTYVSSVINALFMDAVGAEEAAKMLGCGGTAGAVLNNLVNIDFEEEKPLNERMGSIIAGDKEFMGVSYSTEDNVTVSDALNNGWQFYRNENYLKALLFMEKLLTTEKNGAPKYFKNEVVTNGSSYNYKSAQSDMVAPNTKVCMIFEGEWWENEAAPQISDYHTNYNFGWMPLPRPDRSMKHKNVFVDTMDCVAIVKKGLSQVKKDLAFDFMQYTSTKEKLVEFTKTTNTVKGLDYKLTSAEATELKSSLSALGKSIMDFKENADVLSCDTSDAQFMTNLYDAHVFDRYVSTRCTTGFTRPVSYILKKWTDGQVLMKDYFAGTATHYKNTWAK